MVILIFIEKHLNHVATTINSIVSLYNKKIDRKFTYYILNIFNNLLW